MQLIKHFMSSSSPYHCALLNDLHRHFPELLYHAERFHTVQDVLQYIVEIARENPYDREHRRYRSISMPPLEPAEPAGSAEPAEPAEPAGSAEPAEPQAEEEVPVYRYNSLRSTYTLPPSPLVDSASASASTSVPTSNHMDPENLLRVLFQPRPITRPPSNRFRMAVPLDLTSFLSSSYSVPPSSLHSLSPFSDILRPVVIRPTEQHLAENTYVYRSEVSHNENCAICQDPMEAGQETRTILACSHCFHRECVDQWFQEHERCPTCRRDVRVS